MSVRLLLLVAAVCPCFGYVPNPIDGPPHHRTDYTNIQFLANSNIAAGMTNADGTVWITPDSTPMDAINAAAAAWNGIPTTAAHFGYVQPTSLTYSPTDGNNVMVFADDAVTRSFTSGVLAVTAIEFYQDGTIFDTDIYFSPAAQFSTTLATGTYDIQTVVTHELGHALGANHTNILSAAMFYSTAKQDAHGRTLSADDIAFVSALYPPAAGNGYGTISGTATVSGSPLLGGAITAVDAFTGIIVGGFSSLTDGSFSFQVPPGNYYVYVEPAGNFVFYFLNPQTTIFTSFQSGFAGGNGQPSIIPVQAGATSTVALNATAGLTPLKTPFAAISAAGGTGDYLGTFSTRPISLASGQSVDYLFSNPLSAAVTESNIQVLGPATLRPGSLRRDTVNLTDGTAVYRFTLDIPPLTSNAAASLVFKSGTDIITLSGILTFTRPQAVNAASFVGGAVAPGEILSFFGSQLGPASPMGNGGFDANGELSTSVGGITVSFDQTAAPLFYVSNSQINLQVPYEIANEAYTLVTVNYNGSAVVKTTLAVTKAAPGIFVVTNADGSVNGPGSPNSAGGTLVIYGTGAGLASGTLGTGQASPVNATVAATVSLGGQRVTPAFAGLTPGSVGLTQVNIVIPAGTPTGDAVPLQYTVNGAQTQTVNVSVR